MGGIRVSAVDLDHPEDQSSCEIIDDYVIVAAGRCEVTYTNVVFKADGTQTHTITVKGVRRASAVSL